MRPQQRRDAQVRCQRAGVPNPFDMRGMEKVYELTRGVPRAIVIICAHAYRGARRAGLEYVPLDFIEQAAQTTSLPELDPDSENVPVEVANA